MTDIIEVKQETEKKYTIKIEAASVDWLVENTMVNKFSIDEKDGSLHGYQREPKDSHIKKIIDYVLKNKFYFPSCIVCSNPADGTDNKKILQQNKKTYFIVDGQHRIEAFRRMKNDPDSQHRYNEIKDYTIPLTILDQVDEKIEISTFITINKTGRKVDTSLALILKNKMDKKYPDEKDAKIDYLAVELARKMNGDEKGLWFGQIAFGEKVKKKALSLNAFVKAIRRNIRMLEKNNLIDLANLKNDSVNTTIDLLQRIQDYIWGSVRKKWPDLFHDEIFSKSVIAGPIGFTSINKYILSQVNDCNADENLIREKIENSIECIDCPSKLWLKSDIFATYSSESGYSKIVKILKGEKE